MNNQQLQNIIDKKRDIELILKSGKKISVYKDIDERAGIYICYNRINKKAYIGKAVNFKERIKAHNWQLKNDRKRTRNEEWKRTEWQYSYNKHGKSAFEWYVIDRFETEEKRQEVEKLLIDYFDTYVNSRNGYNISEGGNGGRSIFKGMSKERYNSFRNKLKQSLTIEKMGKEKYDRWRKNLSEGHKGLWAGEKNKNYKKGKEIIVYKDGEYFGDFITMREFSKYLEENGYGYVSAYSVSRLVNGGSVSEKGILKVFSAELKTESEIGKNFRGKKLRSGSPKSIIVWKDDKLIGEFPSIFEFAKTLGAKNSGDPISKGAKHLVKGHVFLRGRYKGYSAMLLSEYEKQQAS